jgi:hypothetical protein
MGWRLLTILIGLDFKTTGNIVTPINHVVLAADEAGENF